MPLKLRAQALQNGVAEPEAAGGGRRWALARAERWRLAALTGVLSLAAWLRCFHLDRQGYGNLYYAVAVRSMLRSRRAFFFVAFDPQGFLAVDKPPLGLWAQAASVRIFGWHGWSLFLPQALAGTLSVAALYALVRQRFGAGAGLLAALVLALTPVAVAADRNNTMDSLLVLALLLAALSVQAASLAGRPTTLLLGAFLVAVGFNIKMLQAYLPLPAFGLCYLAAAPMAWRRRALHLALALGVTLLLSLPWVAAVDLTPVRERPFIASSSNSELDLVLGHNGVTRLMENPLHPPTPLSAYVADEIGIPGPLRMWQRQLGGQVSWLLPLAFAGLLIALWLPSPGPGRPGARAAALMWGSWLVVGLLLFSGGHKFHRYYLVMLGPPVAALTGIGLVLMWRHYQARGRRGWLLPAALLATSAGQAALLHPFAPWGDPLAVLGCGISALLAAGLVAVRGRGSGHLAAPLVAAGLVAVLLGPAAWAITPLWGAHPSQPYAGPDLWAAPMDRAEPQRLGRLVAYLRAHQGRAAFLAATIQATTAAPLILASGEAVMALGGYSGGDAILTVEQFAARVGVGDVPFVLLPGETAQQPALVGWVRARCAAVPPAAWRDGSGAGGEGPADGSDTGLTLFDCRRAVGGRAGAFAPWRARL